MLLERDQELESMTELLDGLESSGGKVVLVRGEAGIGKSSLVRGFLDRHADTVHVHVGFCDDLLTAQPLGPFWDIARGEPSLTEPLENGDRAGVLGATMVLLSRSLRPSIVVIEDTQWADEATLDAIKYLGRRIAAANALFILTYRDGAVDYDHPMRRVIGDLPPDSVVRIQIGGLSLSAVASLIGNLNLDADEVLTVTNGNPFLVTQMASSDSDVVSVSVQDSVNARMHRLTPKAQVMVKTLSVVPERIPVAEFLQLTGGGESRLAECEQRGLLTVEGNTVAFRHELLRRAVEASLTRGERVATNRAILAALPAETNPARLVHHAREANDIDRLVEAAPRAARAAAALGAHRQSVEDFRALMPHLDRLDSDAKGPILEEWALEEFLLDNIAEAIEVNERAFLLYRKMGNTTAESRCFAQVAHFYENAGQRHKAEQSAQRAVDVLGADPDGVALARALEVNAYLAMMAGHVTAVPALVDRTLEAGGSDIDERILIRSLNHRGIVANISNYPNGRASLDEARDRSEAAGQWYEECRALFNHAWAAAEFRDIPIASEYAQRAIDSAVRHELEGLEGYALAMFARVLELEGEWDKAGALARDLLTRSAITQMVALPILGAIEARRGRDDARVLLDRAWDLASTADEFQRLAPAATALAEHAWISGSSDLPVVDIKRVMEAGLNSGFRWSTGAIAFWLWKLGELTHAPVGIADPYRLIIEAEPRAAAEMWSAIGCPFERAIALAHGDQTAQLDALDSFETLGATAVANKLKKAMRDRGLSVPRGKSRETKAHPAGLTTRQHEVLELLAEGLSNTEISDRLFVSPRTIENHVSAVLSKLDSATRTEAVSRARVQGLLTDSVPSRDHQ
jgi:DNA-binding CsgD family transcriptional regulator/tetratricopeptide (TPR) repeat protein